MCSCNFIDMPKFKPILIRKSINDKNKTVPMTTKSWNQRLFGDRWVTYQPQTLWNLIQTFVGPLNYLLRILMFYKTDS